MSEVSEVIAGSLPLAKRSHETYAWERSIATAPSLAAKRAGLSPRSGACSKLERNREVQERIAYLAKDEVTVIREKRRRIEERLNLAAFMNLMEFIEIDEETGRFKFVDWRKIKESEAGQVVSEFSFDAKTGELTKFKRDDSLSAIAQLRDMHGFKAPARIEAGGPDGGPILMGEVSDAERVKALAAFMARHKTKSEAA